MLHSALEKPLSQKERGRASCLLAEAYSHMPISMFDGVRELYLETCIREFPETQEARTAFAIYKDNLESISSGSGGVNIEGEQKKRMIELKNLAFGEK